MAATVTNKGTASSKNVLELTLTVAAVSIGAGASVVVRIGGDALNGAPTGVTWNGQALTLEVSRVSAVVGAWHYAKHNVTAGTGDVVVTYGATPPVAKACGVVQIVGLTLSPLGANNNAEGSSTTPSSGTATSTAPCARMGTVVTEGPVADANGTWSSSFTNGQRAGTTGLTDDTNVTLSEGHRTVASGSGAVAAVKTGITSRPWVALVQNYFGAPDQEVEIDSADMVGVAQAVTPAPGAATVALGAAAVVGAAQTATPQPGGVTVALGAAPALAVAQEIAPALGGATVALDPAVMVAQALGIGVAIRRDYPEPGTGVLEAGAFAEVLAEDLGIRSLGEPYFALIQDDLTASNAYVGFEHTMTLAFRLDALPVQRVSPDEHHVLFSLHAGESGGAELLYLGVTPSGRLVGRVAGGLVIESFAGLMVQSDALRTARLDIVATPGGDQLALSLDTVEVLNLELGPGRAANESGVTRFMLFNGVEGATRCACRIYSASLQSVTERELASGAADDTSDGNDATYAFATFGRFPGSPATGTLTVSGDFTHDISSSETITSIRFRVRGAANQYIAGVISNIRLRYLGVEVPIAMNVVTNFAFVLSHLVTTDTAALPTRPDGQPWTWADVNAIGLIEVLADYDIPDIGGIVELAVSELRIVVNVGPGVTAERDIAWTLNEGHGSRVETDPDAPAAADYPGADFSLLAQTYDPSDFGYPLLWGPIGDRDCHCLFRWVVDTRFRRRALAGGDYRRQTETTDYRSRPI